MSKILTIARDARELGDYSDFFEAGTEETIEQIEAAAHFIKSVVDYLQSSGFDVKPQLK